MFRLRVCSNRSSSATGHLRKTSQQEGAHLRDYTVAAARHQQEERPFVSAGHAIRTGLAAVTFLRYSARPLTGSSICTPYLCDFNTLLNLLWVFGCRVGIEFVLQNTSSVTTCKRLAKPFCTRFPSFSHL